MAKLAELGAHLCDPFVNFFDAPEPVARGHLWSLASGRLLPLHCSEPGDSFDSKYLNWMDVCCDM